MDISQYLETRQDIKHIATKWTRAIGILRRINNRHTGMRSDALIMIYGMYVLPILEFGCVLFSGSAKSEIEPLVLLAGKLFVYV